MQTGTTFFNDSDIDSNSGQALTGNKLFLAILLSFLIMSIAVLMGLQLALATEIVWLGFLPLAIGWGLLYPVFKRLEA